MSSRRVAELDDQCLTVRHDPQTDPCAVTMVPECFEWLRDQGYPIESVETVYNAVSLKEDGNTGYLVAEIVTLDYPLDIADAAADQVKLWTCSCQGYHFHRFPDLTDGERPSEAGECSHIERVKRKERQPVDDDSQTELGMADD